MTKKMENKNQRGVAIGLDGAKVLAMWRKCDMNMAEAARRLGCTATTVRYHLKKAGAI